jgi:hypothetical protein
MILIVTLHFLGLDTYIITDPVGRNFLKEILSCLKTTYTYMIIYI